MEKLNVNKLSFSRIKKVASYLVLASFFVLAACDDKGSSGKTVSGYLNSCVNCGNWTGGYAISSFTAQSYNSSVVLRNMVLHGNQGTNIQNQGYYQNNNMNIVNSNYGYGTQQVAVSGNLQILTPSYSYNGCYVPAGSYTVSTIQAGSYSNTYFAVPLLRASGPTNLEMAISGAGANGGAFLYDKNGTGIKSMYGTLQILKVNGRQCSSDFYATLN